MKAWVCRGGYHVRFGCHKHSIMEYRVFVESRVKRYWSKLKASVGFFWELGAKSRQQHTGGVLKQPPLQGCQVNIQGGNEWLNPWMSKSVEKGGGGGDVCSILKSLTLIKCHFGWQRSVFGGRALHKNVLCKVFTMRSEGLSKNCLSQNTVAALCK